MKTRRKFSWSPNLKINVLQSKSNEKTNCLDIKIAQNQNVYEMCACVWAVINKKKINEIERNVFHFDIDWRDSEYSIGFCFLFVIIKMSMTVISLYVVCITIIKFIWQIINKVFFVEKKWNSKHWITGWMKLL